MSALGERAILFTAAEAGAVIRIVVINFRCPVPAASDADEGGRGLFPFYDLMAEMAVWADCHQPRGRRAARRSPRGNVGLDIQNLREGLGRLVREDVGHDLQLESALVLDSH